MTRSDVAGCSRALGRIGNDDLHRLGLLIRIGWNERNALAANSPLAIARHERRQTCGDHASVFQRARPLNAVAAREWFSSYWQHLDAVDVHAGAAVRSTGWFTRLLRGNRAGEKCRCSEHKQGAQFHKATSLLSGTNIPFGCTDHNPGWFPPVCFAHIRADCAVESIFAAPAPADAPGLPLAGFAGPNFQFAP